MEYDLEQEFEQVDLSLSDQLQAEAAYEQQVTEAQLQQGQE